MGENVQVGEFRFLSADGRTQVFVRSWLPQDRQPSFLVQISHGMIEFADRYDRFARFLCGSGAAVYGNDHLGHGHTTPEGEPYGHFADRNGDALVVEDMHRLTQIIRERHPDLPFFLFGHSMGSLLARDYAVHYGSESTGHVFCGTSGPNPLSGAARLLARIGFLCGRRRKPAPLLTSLAFSKYNDRIENPRTPNDWLSRDEEIVDAYNAHPWNSFQFTDQAWFDMACLVDRVSGTQWARALPAGPAYLLISGEMDPVGDYGRGVQQVYGWMQEAALPDVAMKLYPEARHELTNEINRQEVFADVRDWMLSRLHRTGETH